MRLSTYVALAAFAALGFTGFAQEAQLAGPVLGYIFDPSVHALRPVLGIPGAATVGAPLAATAGAQGAFVAPRQDSAVVIGSDGKLTWYGLSAGALTRLTWNGTGAPPRQIVFSPSGTAAALVGVGEAEVVTGLPAAPVAGRTIGLGPMTAKLEAAAGRSGASREHPGAIAISDDGGWLMVAMEGQVRILSTAGSGLDLMAASSSARLAFARGTHDAAVADDLNGPSLTWIHDVAGAASIQLVSQDAHLAHPVGLAFSADGASLLVSTADQAVVTADLVTSKVTAQSCACAPAELQAMGNVFRLNELGQGPLWVADPQTATPRLLFVPPPASSN